MPYYTLSQRIFQLLPSQTPPILSNPYPILPRESLLSVRLRHESMGVLTVSASGRHRRACRNQPSHQERANSRPPVERKLVQISPRPAMREQLISGKSSTFELPTSQFANSPFFANKTSPVGFQHGPASTLLLGSREFVLDRNR